MNDEIELGGSAGDPISIGAPDTDGEMEFRIDSGGGCYDCGGDRYAYLGVEARQELIRFLMAHTPAGASDESRG
jgi:hypothetical protein